jgi:ABC-type Fe3+/spermidine/putrescine transport system ATPase subunit
VARVVLDRIRKAYPGLVALDDISVTINSGEFFTLLGPSGCGKTTLLRTIAGFSKHDSGQILVADERIDDVPAHKRNIGMVYQDYAIFPHMSVAQNVAFGLVTRGCARQEISDRVGRALNLVQLFGLADRQPHELSGGQQQRVALARAMVINPRILLMDEPLSNLDAKLRIELRDDIRDLQQRLGITTIYVTHDQEEALVTSDRICIMERGRVHQIGSPQDVYARPETLFIASFVGGMNLVPDIALGPGGELQLGAMAHRFAALAGRANITLAIRPEDVVLPRPHGASGPAIAVEGVIEKTTYAGREAFYRVVLDSDLRVLVHLHRPEQDRLERVGARIPIELPLARLHAFDPLDGKRIPLAS